MDKNHGYHYRKYMDPARIRKKHFLLGFIFILVGGVLLLKNLNLLPETIPAWVISWKMALIAVGVLLLFKRKWVPGLVMIGIGKYLLLPEVLGIERPDIYQLWPVLIIVIGIGTILKAIFPGRNRRTVIIDKQTSDFMESTVIFGGDMKKISSYDLKGGKLTAIFGGLDIDFTDSCLSKEGTEFELVAVMGGINLKVPKEWNVKTEIVPVVGGVHDEIQDMPDAYVDPAAVITLKGVVVMGGVDIKRV